MSLLSEAMENCKIYTRQIVSDGRGGFITTYTEGVTFAAAITYNSSVESRVAEASQSIGAYTVTTTKSINLQYHDVLKRLSDNKVFRVTTDGDDNKSPVSASLDMRIVNAEEWELPNG